MRDFRGRHAALAAILALVAACQPRFDPDRPITLSVIGTNDAHGSLMPVDGNRGLTLFAGYVDNLRAVRADDGGAVLLIDAGDMWQGTLESNLSEGAAVVAAYNAIAYDAAAIGNHEFDFGPVGPRVTPAKTNDDPRGALKLRASEAHFPLLAANLIDQKTGKAVAWPNVRPSVLIERAGVRIGILGLIAERALLGTIAANVRGLSVAPLAPAATGEARTLRDAGAELVIVTAHAGSSCEEFGDPSDLSSCNMNGEIMQLALDLPTGLVDQIVAGHVHRGIAHEVNGIAIVSSYSNMRAFGRVDYVLDRNDHSLISRTIFPPHQVCGYADQSTGNCIPAGEVVGSTQLAFYSGSIVTPNEKVVSIARDAARRASELKSEKLGVYLETPITRQGRANSDIGRIFVEILHDAIGGDVVIHNVVGGIRTDLPQGELTYGAVYEMFPFDNVIVQLELTGAEIRRILEHQLVTPDRRAGVAGIRVDASCENGSLELAMLREDGTEIADDDILVVTTNNFLATGGDDIFSPVIPEGGFSLADDGPLVREEIADWMREFGGSLNADSFKDDERSNWSVPDAAGCLP